MTARRLAALRLPAALLLALAWAEPGLAQTPAVPHVPRGAPAPEFTVERLVGGTLSLSSLRGRVVVLDFWASWCPPCREELPWLLSLARRFEARGVVLVAMNQDEGPAQRRLAEAFAAQVPGLSRTITLGGPQVGGPYRVDGLPTLYVIDRQGRVFASAEGRLTEGAVAAVIERVLAP